MQMQLPPASVLVICTRRLGDVLLTPPLIRSIKRAWPQVPIDALVFAGTQEVLKHNPDIRHILTVPERPAFLAHLRFTMRLFRSYGLAISTLAGIVRPYMHGSPAVTGSDSAIRRVQAASSNGCCMPHSRLTTSICIPSE